MLNMTDEKQIWKKTNRIKALRTERVIKGQAATYDIDAVRTKC